MSSSLHILLLTLITLSHGSLARRQNDFKHEAMDASRKRTTQGKALELLAMNFITTEQCPAATSTYPPILSIVFPSPNAIAVEVTEQSQVVTSYIPEMTWCVGPAVGFVPITTGIFNQTGPPYYNYSTQYEETVDGTGYCETVYSPTTTTVCATTLTGLASKVAITECDQEVTFSSECGFTLETPTPITSNNSLITLAPTVRKISTFWMAPWQSLIRGETPSHVDVKICTVLDDRSLKCLRIQEVWEVVVVTKTVTTQRQINLVTTISGPGTLIIETMQVFITDTIETVDLSTILSLETEIETETTSKGTRLVTGLDGEIVPPASVVYITKNLKHRSTISAAELTTNALMTSIATQYVGTITWTSVRPRSTLLELIGPEF